MQNQIVSNSNRPTLREKLRSHMNYNASSQEAKNNAFFALIWQISAVWGAFIFIDHIDKNYAIWFLLIGLAVGIGHSLSVFLKIHPSKLFTWAMGGLAIFGVTMAMGVLFFV